MVTTSRFQEHFNTQLFEQYIKVQPVEREHYRLSTDTTISSYSTKSNKNCTLKRENRVKPRNRLNSLTSEYAPPEISNKWTSWLLKLRIKKE